MFRGGRYRGRAGGSAWRGRGGSRNSTHSKRIKGVFADGVWHCNCTPRLPAEHFEVKKEGKNQGRWFYTCQQNESKRCDFFLWEDDAKPREEAAVLNNSRSEPRVRALQDDDAQVGWKAGRHTSQSTGKGMFASMPAQPLSREVDEETASEGSPSPSKPPVKMNNAVKRTVADAFNDEDDEAFPWPLSGQEEAEIASIADVTAPETPHKSLKTGVYATPGTTGGKRRLPWLEPQQPTTPTTATKTVSAYFDTPSKTSSTGYLDAEQAISAPDAPPAPAVAKAPSPPLRYKDALSNPADSASSLTSEALAVLANVGLPPDTLSSLRSILSKHDLKTQGISKGRDISRLAMKARDVKIVELNAKIARLEAEKEVDRSLIRQLKWAKEHGLSDEEEL